jgi:hypothetical protein
MLGQEIHPGIGPDDEADPEGQDDQDQREALQAAGMAGTK